MAFHLYTGNRLETLARAFLENVYSKREPENPLVRVTAAVQTQGTALWLRQYLAEHSPVAANLETPFLRTAVESFLKMADPEFAQGVRGSAREAMSWRIFSRLSRDGGAGISPEVDGYLADDPDLRKRRQLSERLAGLYDQYRVYRPEFTAEWRAGDFRHGGWQGRLHQELFGEEMTLDRCFERFFREGLPEGVLPGGTSVFGVNSMPPLFLRFFAKLSETAEVHFFYLNPSEAYWADAVSKAEARRRARTSGEYEEMIRDTNPLLASFGVQSREFFREMTDLQEWLMHDDGDFQTPPIENVLGPALYPECSVLKAIQQDIFSNFTRGSVPSAFTGPALSFEPEDDSVVIENCHTPIREVEVLHDLLLRELEKPGVRPRDILVIAPDINKYAACIESVFGGGELAGMYTIADRSLRDSGVLAPVFLKLLALPGTGFPFSEVFALLETRDIREKFGVSAEDIPRLRDWVRGAGVRWGIDARDREIHCGTAFDEYSWKMGLDRILLGFALRSDPESQTGLPVIPFDSAEGADAAVLGGFLSFAKALFALREELSGRRTPVEWIERLRKIPETFFEPDRSTEEELTAILDALGKIAEDAEECEEEVPLAVMLESLKTGALDAPSETVAFLRGKITFCSMVPMRSIPMPVIAILGLNQGEFPRRDARTGFDLISSAMRPTDRSKSLEDRGLFLESILSAGKKLILSYTGQDCRDNSEEPPAAPLAEFMEYLSALTGKPPEELAVKQKLQACAQAYFTGDDRRLFTYSKTARTAAESLRNAAAAGEERETPRNFETLFPERNEAVPEPEELDFRDLMRFFRSPVAWYLREHAGLIEGNDQTESYPDEEPFEPDALEIYSLRKDLFEWKLRKVPEETQYEILDRTARLPVGGLGREVFRKALRDVEEMLTDQFLENYVRQQRSPLDFRAGDVRFTGEFLFAGNSRYVFHPSERKSRHLARLWLEHTMLCAAFPDAGFRTAALFRNGGVAIAPLGRKEAADQLKFFTDLLSRGSVRPVPFFLNAAPESADDPEKLAEQVLKNLDEDPAAAGFYLEEDFEDEEFRRELAAVTKEFYRGMRLEDLP